MADPNSVDKSFLAKDRCPDCNSILFKKLFNGIEKPVCMKCDTWFEIWSNGCVVRNLEAHKHYMQTDDEEGNRWEGIFDITN